MLFICLFLWSIVVELCPDRSSGKFLLVATFKCSLSVFVRFELHKGNTARSAIFQNDSGSDNLCELAEKFVKHFLVNFVCEITNEELFYFGWFFGSWLIIAFVVAFIISFCVFIITFVFKVKLGAFDLSFRILVVSFIFEVFIGGDFVVRFAFSFIVNGDLILFVAVNFELCVVVEVLIVGLAELLGDLRFLVHLLGCCGGGSWALTAGGHFGGG
mmetsp:Transcript_3854/g.4705  ORF Transcript_3854/g.4705 Transcript_3854/m.4705 type:complete len:215 (+) Transcript_3854:709-1353(+)